jgi:acyl-CoA thioesterase I
MRRLLFILVLCFAGSASGAAPPAILVMGDSLSAAYGIPLERGWVQLLQQRLEQQGYPHRVVNGSVSGETTAGGLARLPAALDRHRPAVVLIELGANDGLRGLPLAELRKNLRELARLSRAAGARPVLFEMRIPPNYGPAYAEGFFRAFGEVATASGAALVPFFLEPIAFNPEAFQDDGIHPTVDVQPLLLDRVWPVLEPLLKQSRRR